MRGGLKTLARLAQTDAGPLADVLIELEALVEVIRAARDPNALLALAAAMPARVGHLRAETSLALQAIAVELARYRPTCPSDLDTLEPQLRVPWLRAWICADAAAAVGGLGEDTLLAIIQGWSFERVLDPRPLLAAMLDASDPRLRLDALSRLEAAVCGLVLGPREVYRAIAPLLEDRDPDVRALALAMSASGWMGDLTPADAGRRGALVVQALGAPELGVAEAAVTAAASLGEHDALRAAIEDEAQPTVVRAAAIVALAPYARDEDLDRVLAVPEVGFGASVRAFLLGAHRHGVFVRERHLEAVLRRFDANTGWTAEELVRITHVVRGAMTSLLAAAPPDDPRWHRRASLLSMSVDPAAHELLATLLEGVQSPPLAVAFIRAVARTSEPPGRSESSLLAWLDRLPEEALPALACKGGEATVQRLRVWAIEPMRSPPHRRLAIETLWKLAPDRRALAGALVRALGPHESGLLEGALYDTEASLTVQLLIEPLEPPADVEPIEPKERLRLLSASRDVEHMPEVERAFREQVVDCVRRAQAGDFKAKRVELPVVEQLVYRYGRNLVDARRSVRRVVADEPETGRDLLLRFIIDWLREAPEPPVIVALLEIIARHAPSGADLRAIEPYWRHNDREVQRAAIEAIVEAGGAARGLELSLCRLVDHPEPRLTARALAAVATWQASWAEPLVIGALEHREMGVKKAAAEALAVIATPRSIPKLVRGLATHDNRAFRASLQQALAKAAGPVAAAVLIEALEDRRERREVQLLWDALDGAMTIAMASRVAQDLSAARAELIDACLDGVVTLADGKPHDLAAALHRAKLRAPESTETTAADRLRVEGFSVARALAVVEALRPEVEGATVDAIRQCVPEWTSWLGEDRGAPIAAVHLLLDACRSTHRDQLDAVFALVEARLDSIAASKVGRWIERCVVPERDRVGWRARGIDLLRALLADPAWGGLPRYHALTRLGAVVTQEDLHRLLELCRGAPDYPAQSAALLREALQIPPWSKDEPELLGDLREQALRWFSMDPQAREAWLRWAVGVRPLGLTAVPERVPASKPRFVPRTPRDLDALQVGLEGADPGARARAAGLLLEWSEVPEASARVLAAFLERPIALTHAQLGQITAALDAWPTEPAAREHAAKLAGYLDPLQRRTFVRTWVDAWEAAEAWSEPLLRRSQDDLLPIAWARAHAGDHRLARLICWDGSLAVQAYARRVGAVAPEEVEHLRPKPRPPTDQAAPSDRIHVAGVEELAALLDEPNVAPGLVVRAVHALSRLGERAADPLDAHVIDPRPPVRSAALRALRRVAPGARYLDAATRALQMEDRRDVVISLMKTIAHGRYAPALPRLVEHLWHRDPRMRRAAHDALLAWGHDAVSELRRAQSRARPDRRQAIGQVLEAIESTERPD